MVKIESSDCYKQDNLRINPNAYRKNKIRIEIYKNQNNIRADLGDNMQN